MISEREQAIARAIFLTLEMQELRKRVSGLAPARREAFRVLHEDYGMTLREIGTEVGISGPRVYEIIRKPASPP